MMVDKVGIRIRTYRQKIGLSVEELAKNSGLDVDVITNIEGGKTYPAIGVLIKISRALGQRLGTFMDDQFIDDPLIVRHDARKEETASHKGGAEGYHYYPLGKGKTDRHMEPFFIEVEPGKQEELSSHEGEEFVVVVSGEVELCYGSKRYFLRQGDSMFYNSIVPHFVGATNGSKAAIYAVLFLPL